MDTYQSQGKRKSPLQPLLSGAAYPEILSVQNKRIVSELSKGRVPVQLSSVSSKTQYLPASFVTNASVSCKQTAPRKPISQKPVPVKPRNDSYALVRSKMRESLASSLALVQSTKVHGECATNSLQGRHVSEAVTASSDVLSEFLTITKTADSEETIAQEAQAVKPFPQDNVSYSDNVFTEGDLLQGNELSWALESDIVFTEHCQNHTIGSMIINDVTRERSMEKLLLDPQVLSFKIEAELFELFGGVNKKYKEKGRSLLFNLKDKNNPKLREKVMYGEIPAERLCSMSAEELASKELAEWRQAKAEEMAQMVVLQDTEVDIRSLVRKTHKGEFKVEVEPMEIGSVEISVGSSSVNWSLPRNIKKKPLGVKNALNNIVLTSRVAVDDEMQAATGSLAPIVSLEDFMSSMDSVSPSDYSSSDTGKSHVTDNHNTEEVLILTPPKESAHTDLGTSTVKAEDCDLVSSKSCSDLKPAITAVSVPAGERVWEGALQFSVSSVSSVIGILKSVEKTSTEEWPLLLEIKGRVRLDAFQKFVKELPNSRSRAVTVMRFVCKEECLKTEQENMSEVVDSYAKDERVGFAEPASGVELYLCPNRGRSAEILNKIVPRNHLDFSLDDNNGHGLIGVVVWRRPQFKKPTPPLQSNTHKNHHNVSSLTKHNNKSRYSNMVQVNHDDGGDLPPGFGPVAKDDDDDDDDLPEFNYVVMNGTRRSESLRELIHKYGKSEPLLNRQTNQTSGLDHVNGGSMVRPQHHGQYWSHQAGGRGY
ncbi:unnamed protein product [Cochlearia groenlandica]